MWINKKRFSQSQSVLFMSNIIGYRVNHKRRWDWPFVKSQGGACRGAGVELQACKDAAWPTCCCLFIYYFSRFFSFFFSPLQPRLGLKVKGQLSRGGILQGEDPGDGVQVSQVCPAAAPGLEYICVFIERGWNGTPQRPGHHHHHHHFPCRCCAWC